MSRYEKKFGTYYLMNGKNIVHAGDEIAVAFCISTIGSDEVITMHKIGPVDSVGQWVSKSNKEWQQTGLADIAGEILMISSDKWDVEDLNNILENCSFIAVFLKRENISVAELTTKNRGQQLGSSSDNLTHDT